jgi:hypothetical protein
MIDKHKTYNHDNCIYDIKKQNEIVNSVFNNSSKKDNKTDTILINFIKHYFDKILYFKDESFSKEEEYRITYFGKSDEIKHREGKSMIIPYIEFSTIDDIPLPITEIIVGPTPHPELSKMSVEGLLEHKGYKRVKVKKSEIPYRSW